jgi:hypothetical protein
MPLLLVNVGMAPYDGRVALSPGAWRAANPADGTVRTLEPAGSLSLPARSAVVIIGPPP